MPQEWQVLASLGNTVTVIGVLIIGAYLMVGNKVHTKEHTDDVVRGKDEVIAALREERDAAVKREEAARRELAENTAVLARLDGAIREALTSLRRR